MGEKKIPVNFKPFRSPENYWSNIPVNKEPLKFLFFYENYFNE